MDASIASVLAIVVLVIALNFFFLSKHFRGSERRSRKTRVAVEEAQQAKWRDNEIRRRIEREQDGALERVKLRNETLALYDEVRRRAAAREAEGALHSSKGWESVDDADNLERFR